MFKKLGIVVALVLVLGALGFTGNSPVSAAGGPACGVNTEQVVLITPVQVRAEPWSLSNISGNFVGTVNQWVAVEEQSTGSCFVRLTDNLSQVAWALLPDLQVAIGVQPVATATQGINGPQPTFTPIADGIVPTSTAPANVALPPAPLPACNFAAGDATGFPMGPNITVSGYMIVVDKNVNGSNNRTTARVVDGSFTSGVNGAHVWYYTPNPCDIEAERAFVLP